ncbi:Myosin-3 [Dirofilaria immitis]
MGEHLDVENFSSTILRKQLEQIKEKFWYSMAEKLASECDKLEEDNVKLENLINDRETRLNELKNLNAELLEEAHYLDNDTHEIKSIASSSS